MARPEPRLATESEQEKRLHEQDAALKLCSATCGVLERFFAHCASTMQSFAAGDAEVEIDHDLLDSLAAQGESALLERVPEELWERLRAQAARVPMSRRRNLGDYDPLVRADLKLRKLSLLTLKAASHPYRGRLRSVEWNRMIWMAQVAYDEAKDGWEFAGRRRTWRRRLLARRKAVTPAWIRRSRRRA